MKNVFKKKKGRLIKMNCKKKYILANLKEN